MPVGFTVPAYSSTHPALAQLFANEFAQQQQANQMAQALNAHELGRAQVAAQRDIYAQQLRSQQQQQDLANLFKMSELQDRRQAEAERNRLSEMDIKNRGKYYDAIGGARSGRSAQEIEADNAASEGIASALNGALQTRLKTATAELEKRRKDELDALWKWGGLTSRPGDSKVINDKYDRELKALTDRIAQEVQDMGTRYYPPGSYKFNPLTGQFEPVRISSGSASGSATAPRVGGGGTPSPVPFDVSPIPADTLSTPFGSSLFSVRPSPTPTPAPAPSAAPPAFSNLQDIPNSWALSAAERARLLGSAPAATPAPAPVVTPAPTPTPAAPPPFSLPTGRPWSGGRVDTGDVVRIPIGDGQRIEMSAADAAATRRQLSFLPPEQVPAAAAAIQRQLVQLGRARIVTEGVQYSEPSTPGLPPEITPGTRGPFPDWPFFRTAPFEPYRQ